MSDNDVVRGPQLPVKEAARFLDSCYTEAYKKTCLQQLRELWGDRYADQVKAHMSKGGK